MLWSLVKIIFFIALIGVLTLTAGALLDARGGLQVTITGFEFTLAPLQAAILAVILLLLVWLILKILSLMMAVVRF